MSLILHHVLVVGVHVVLSTLTVQHKIFKIIFTMIFLWCAMNFFISQKITTISHSKNEIYAPDPRSCVAWTERIHPRSHCLRGACQRWIFLLQKTNQCVFLSSGIDVFHALIPSQFFAAGFIFAPPARIKLLCTDIGSSTCSTTQQWGSGLKAGWDACRRQLIVSTDF